MFVQIPISENPQRRMNQPREMTLMMRVRQPEIVPVKILTYASTEGFTRKPLYHFAVIGYRQGRFLLYDVIRKGRRNETQCLTEILRIADETDWSYELLPLYSELHRTYPWDDEEPVDNPVVDERWSLIQHIYVPQLPLFYYRVDKLLGITRRPVSLPFTHITLYTKGANPRHGHDGIGVQSLDGVNGYRELCVNRWEL